MAADNEHTLTRRGFLGAGGLALPLSALAAASTQQPSAGIEDRILKEAIDKLEYLTPPERVFILDKGKADVRKLPVEALREIGLVPETWSLEVMADPQSNSVVERPLTRALGNALTWDGLMGLARQHAVRFLHVCTCTNGANPYHVGLWEGVPLREVIRLVAPRDNVRRVYYQSYHREGQPPFQSSLPLGQVLECPPGDMPVTLAYRMNGQLIPAALGGPVRMVVPGSYGSRSIKWVQRLLLTNDFKANDSDADLNNDPDNALKTRARFVNEPKDARAGVPFAVTGLAQVGVSGLSKVQYSVHPAASAWPADDPHRVKADWKDATILPPPSNWGGGLPEGKLPGTNQTAALTGVPLQWPLRYTIVHWAALVPGLPPGNYEIACRTVDMNGIAQPMPRTLPRTGFNTIHVVTVAVSAAM